ncbi:hypothetical protein D3C81_1387330 [compost metagenome]
MAVRQHRRQTLVEGAPGCIVRANQGRIRRHDHRSQLFACARQHQHARFGHLCIGAQRALQRIQRYAAFFNLDDAVGTAKQPEAAIGQRFHAVLGLPPIGAFQMR